MQYQYSDRVNAMRPSIIRELLKQMADPTLISFAGGNPDADAFPVADIRAISDDLLANEGKATLQYSITEGYGPLREAGRAWLNRAGEVAREGDEVIVLSGSQQAMDFMAKLLVNPGDVVATEDPAFLGAMNSFRSYEAALAPVPLEADGVDLAALEAVLAASPKPRFFYTIPNFQNPTGVTMSLAKRRRVYELCVRYGVPILEDDPYGELRIAGEALPPIKSFDTEGAVVHAASMSKMFAPGLRVALCAGPREFVGKMVVAKQGNDVHSNLWAQRVCERFLATRDVAAHLARLRGIYRDKAQYMMAALDRELAGRASYLRPEGGMFLWLTLPEGVDMQEYVRRCLQNRLALVPGNAFFVNDEVPCQSVRVNFSTPTREQIDKGAAVMGAVLREMLG